MNKSWFIDKRCFVRSLFF